jgi:hypothetical protein
MPVEHQGKVWRQALDKRVRPRDILNYENTQQLLLIGARKKDIQGELEIDLNEEKETENTAELFKELRIKREQVPLKPLLKGEFPGRTEQLMSQEVRRLSREEAP